MRRRRGGKKKTFLSVRNELGPDQELFIVRMYELFSRRKGMFSIPPYGVDLM